VVVVATLTAGEYQGRGECVPYPRYGECAAEVQREIEGCPERIETAESYIASLAPGAARNALDCAMWDLRAKRAGRSVAEIIGAVPPAQTPASFTLSVASPRKMAEAAEALPEDRSIKMKLDGRDDLAKIAAVRRVQPIAPIVVDANESWDVERYLAWAAPLAEFGVAALEQPLPAGQDAALGDLPRPVPVVADESIHTRAELPSIERFYDGINLKLDKAGGLTEALALRNAARDRGLAIMVGCMVATSLAVAPAWLLIDGARWVDLDGPALLLHDRALGSRFADAWMYPPKPRLWGHPPLK